VWNITMLNLKDQGVQEMRSSVSLFAMHLVMHVHSFVLYSQMTH